MIRETAVNLLHPVPRLHLLRLNDIRLLDQLDLVIPDLVHIHIDIFSVVLHHFVRQILMILNEVTGSKLRIKLNVMLN